MVGITIIMVVVLIVYLAKLKKAGSKKSKVDNLWVTEDILSENIAFFRGLDTDKKLQFKNKVIEFLDDVRITGIHTTVDNVDRIMVASSAVIPVFAFTGWKYINLQEVLLYADTFNTDFQTEGEGRNIMGMVGSGYMEGKMLLSKYALEEGFKNDSDKNNTGIHEFVHLIDKTDGSTDGIPELLLSKQYTLPWLDLTFKKMQEILKEKSDINPYGATNKAEFFAVVSEYFFERPDLLQQKHPDLYTLLEQIFKQDPTIVL